MLLTGAVAQGKPVALKLQALHGWAALVQALLDHAPTQLANVMHQVLMMLTMLTWPVFSSVCPSDEHLICFGQIVPC